MIAFVFPGQGTVRVGMGGWLRRDPVAAEVLARADAVAPVSELCARGPLERLVDAAQPAVTACNLAALAVLTERGVRPDVVAGHSVGELSALCAAGVLDVDATLRLVAIRSRLMAAVPDTGGMAAVIGLPVARVAELAAAAATPDEPLVVGLENAADHVVVSGAFAAIERMDKSEARKVVPLKVANAFHSPLMAAAVDGWALAVRETAMSAPRVPVIPNATAEPTTDLAVVKDALIEQLTARVRWTATMARLSEADTCVEVGDSKVLTGLMRASGPRCVTMADPGTPRRLRREPVA
ncbi:ACP S-malonyltransferase [Actinokineospora sp. UTMC 2448]|uniref:ACP S-malonyltransferase n=1 Tax=Actinokineospora sp. UTMC 2448 TaxID=2268449 RepID=UPI0021646C9C|nr:ACP S-malonyltransferase [Actinokineospora sp. UTMC 2448]UVS76686.1 Polyketide biosynthesis malonyl CoA-acyl carrier protein transacylase PksC [Actinokineospora sp. UTMC 2448]